MTQTGLLTTNGGITNNSTLSQVGTATFTAGIIAPSITSSSSSIYAGSGNNFDSTAISAPKVVNGIASGTADGSSYTQFNLAINSWQGVGFVYSNAGAPPSCNLVINNRTGDLTTKGNLSTASTTASSTTETGLLIVSRGTGIAGNCNVGGNVNITST